MMVQSQLYWLLHAHQCQTLATGPSCNQTNCNAMKQVLLHMKSCYITPCKGIAQSLTPLKSNLLFSAETFMSRNPDSIHSTYVIV